MANIQQIVAVTKLMDNVLHKREDGLYEYDTGWNDARVGEDVGGLSAAQVRGVRTQLGRKLVPKERAFEKLVRLHNELCNRTANGDLVFMYEAGERNET